MTTPLPLPPGWRTHPSPDPVVLTLAHPGRTPASGVLPSLELLAPPGSRPGSQPDPRHGPPDDDLEDADSYVDDAGRDVCYRRWSPAGHEELVCECWAWPGVAGSPLLVATVSREDYLDLCDLFEWLAELVDPDHLAALPRPA